MDDGDYAELQALRARMAALEEEKAAAQQKSQRLKEVETIATFLEPNYDSPVILSLPFVNREQEVEQVAATLLRNRTIAAVDRNTILNTLVTSFQSDGAGKTTFGRCFLGALDHTSPSIREHRYFADLSGSLYVHLDLTPLATRRSMTLQAAGDFQAVNLVLYSCLLFHLPQDKRQPFREALMPVFRQWSALLLLRTAQNLLQRNIFLHLDEMDLLTDDQSNAGVDTFYDFWERILFPLMCDGFYLFCSGRIPQLYFAGRGQRLTTRKRSVGTTICVLLPSLKRAHVEFILHTLQLPSDFASLIFHATHGVPRLVFWAVQFVKTLLPQHLSLSITDFVSHLYRFMRADVGAAVHLRPDLMLKSDVAPMYFEFVRVAAFGVPIDVGHLQPNALRMRFGESGLDLLSNLLLHISDKEGETDSLQVFLSFPPILLRSLSEDEVPLLPFYSHLLQVSHRVTGTLLETAVRRCLQLQFYSDLSGGTPVGLTLPGLTQSQVGDMKFTAELELAAHVAGTSMQLQGNTIYVSSDNGASTDLVVCGSRGLALALLLVQCKDGHQEVTLSMIATEATKAFIPTYVQTLCILCVGGVNASVFEHPQALVTAQAISFPCGANLSDTLTLPDSIDVVIVTEEGLKSFVSEPNYQLLRTAVSPLALALLYQNNRG